MSQPTALIRQKEVKEITLILTDQCFCCFLYLHTLIILMDVVEQLLVPPARPVAGAPVVRRTLDASKAARVFLVEFEPLFIGKNRLEGKRGKLCFTSMVALVVCCYGKTLEDFKQRDAIYYHQQL